MRLTTALLAGAVLQAPAMATAQAAPLLLVHETHDVAIERAFRSVLNRAPTALELRRYRILMGVNGWSESDVRRDLRERTDYRSVRVRRGVTADFIVTRAYQDILGRDPDPEGLRNYRSKILDDGWSERDVREALRSSDEYAASTGPALGFRTRSAERIVRRAYQDILGREPDPGGLENYRRLILEEGWDEHDVRQALIRSPERRQQRLQTTNAAATDMVTRAYRSVLGREPDAGGLSHYVSKVLHERWSEEDVVQALRESDEYRDKQR